MKIVIITTAALISSATVGSANPLTSESPFTAIIGIDHDADISRVLAQNGHNSLIVVNPCPDVGECPEPFGEPSPPEAENLIQPRGIPNMIQLENY